MSHRPKRILRSGKAVDPKDRARVVYLLEHGRMSDAEAAQQVGVHPDTIGRWRREGLIDPARQLCAKMIGERATQQVIEKALAKFIADPDAWDRRVSRAELLHQHLTAVDAALARASAAAEKQGGFESDPQRLLAYVLRKRALGAEPPDRDSAVLYWDLVRAEVFGLALELESYEPIGASERERNPTWHPTPESWKRDRRALEARLPYTAPAFPTESAHVFEPPPALRAQLEAIASGDVTITNGNPEVARTEDGQDGDEGREPVAVSRHLSGDCARDRAAEDPVHGPDPDDRGRDSDGGVAPAEMS